MNSPIACLTRVNGMLVAIPARDVAGTCEHCGGEIVAQEWRIKGWKAKLCDSCYVDWRMKVSKTKSK